MDFRNFNKKIFKGFDVEFIGNNVFVKVDELVIAKIEPQYMSVYNEYNLYEVKILNKKNGIIDSQKFFFNDELKQSDRIDEAYKSGRKDVKYFNAAKNRQGEIDWDFAVPKSSAIKRYTNQIMEYIELFK